MRTTFLFPDAVRIVDKFLVCRETVAGDEHVIQSEINIEMAELSVEQLNEHERLNARLESYYWRNKIGEEGDDIQRNRIS